jgi:hypothetical protein
MRARTLALSCPLLLVCKRIRLASRYARLAHGTWPKILSHQKCTISAFMAEERKFRARREN